MTAPLSSPPAAGRANGSPRWALARRTLKPAYALYYRALYSREFPGKEMLAGLVLGARDAHRQGRHADGQGRLGGEISGGRLGVHARPPPGASVRGDRVARSPPAPGRRDPRRRLRRRCSAGSPATARVQPLSRRRRRRDRRRAGRCCRQGRRQVVFRRRRRRALLAGRALRRRSSSTSASTTSGTHGRASPATRGSWRRAECSSSPPSGRLAATRSCATS